MEAALIDDGVMGLKTYATVGGGATFVVQLFDSETGKLIAVIDADRLGQLRTGAASGVAAKVLAREDATTVGIIGTGYQAQTQLEAVCAVRSVGQVRAFSRTAATREAFARTMAQRLGVAVTAVESAEAAVRDADVIITVTTAREPVLAGEWLKPGACVLAAGGNHVLRREIDSATLERAHPIVADDLDQAKTECGELIAAAERGKVRWEAVRELRQVVAGQTAGRGSADAITVFASQGVALEDVAVARRAFELAEQHNVGTTIRSD
jgi:ornithine cyclodeaminase/alanine dehydrogenase